MLLQNFRNILLVITLMDSNFGGYCVGYSATRMLLYARDHILLQFFYAFNYDIHIFLDKSYPTL